MTLSAQIAARIAVCFMAGAAMAVQAAPAIAKVTEVSDRGFVIRHFAEVPATPEAVWAMLGKPSEWWDAEHTWSGDSANLSLEARAGGCFCETLPNTASPKAAPRGSVEHMRVVYAERPRALRMIGSLGPLQADATIGTMTFQIKPVSDGKRTQLLLEYVVGGYVRTPMADMAQAVDGVLALQINRLAAQLGAAKQDAAISQGGESGGEFSEAFPDAPGEAEPSAPGGEIPGVLPLSAEPLEPRDGNSAGR